MRFKKIAAFVLAAIMAGSLAACNTNSESNSAADSGSAAQAGGGESNADDDKEVVLRLAENWDFSLGIVPSLNPSVASNYGSIYWGRNFYDTLVAYDKNGEIVGQLAESWEVSDDGKDYTFKLRDGVKFSDGTDLTADAVKLSFEAAIENLGMYNGSYGMLSKLISETEVVDGKTVVLHLTQPYYGTLNDLTMSCPLAIINPAAFDGQEDLMYGESFKNASFGTGAYMYAGDNANGVYTFVRNPYYWGEAPEVDSFTVTAIEDNDAKLLALKSGEIDAIINTSHVSFDGFAEMAANPEFNTAMDERSNLTRYLGMNVTNAPFNDLKVRQAVAYAIDQSVFEASVFNGYETAAETLFSKTKPYCDVELTTYGYDVEKAKALLAEAGWTDSDGDGILDKDGAPFEVELNYQTSHANIDNMALTIASQLAAVGIKVNVKSGDMMTYYAAMGTSPLLIASSYGGAYDPSTLIANMNPSVSTDPLSVQYAPFFEEGILDEINSTASETRVAEIYESLLSTIADQSLLVPISQSHELAIWNDSVISGYSFGNDPNYIIVAGFDVK